MVGWEGEAAKVKRQKPGNLPFDQDPFD
jgi:hypothetical protein